MATRPCVDCNCPLQETAIRCPICGSKDPFGRRDTHWFVAAIAIILIVSVGATGLFLWLQFR